MRLDSKKSAWIEFTNWNGLALSVGFLLFLSLVVGSTGELLAQKNFNPDHPEVEAMVDKAVKYLEKNATKDLGKSILAALAIVEARKRYYQEIPSSNPVVTAAIAQILEAMPADPTKGSGDNLFKSNEMYAPSLALILLAEVDQSKHKEPIKRLIKFIQDRQEKSGAFTYKSEGGTGDTSQTQYAALALYVAKHHGFTVDVKSPAGALQWLAETQQNGGYFIYKLKPSGRGWVTANRTSEATLSIHAAGLGTAYLLADLLQLTARKKSLTKVAVNDEMVGLPKTVSPYIKPVDGEDSLLNQIGPLVDFDIGRLNATFHSGNAFYERTFNISLEQWTFYTLYALERYAWFREQAEGDLGNGKLAGWYDDGVNFLKKQQGNDGSFQKKGFPLEDQTIASAFGILFLVRSSEVISMPSNESDLLGGEGFPSNQQISANGGQLVSSDAEKNLSSMIEMLQQDPTPEQLEALTKSMKKAIGEFKSKDDKSRGEIKSFLRTMIAAPNFYRRKIAVRFLAGEQDMDNVPALIYALGDPDMRVCIEAHDGLRLISRKIDSISLTDQTRNNAGRDPGILEPTEKTAARMEFDSLKKQWTEWFLKIRPDAELLD